MSTNVGKGAFFIECKVTPYQKHLFLDVEKSAVGMVAADFSIDIGSTLTPLSLKGLAIATCQ